jgi:4-hydroxy-tetrahydrodipicolinate reductase
MRIAIIGDGKMGQAIAALAAERGHEVTAMLGIGDNADGRAIAAAGLGNPDVAIEFTEPGSAVANVVACARAGIPVVVGTTGWYAHLPIVMAEIEAAGSAMLWAPNFSLGVAVLTAAVEAAAAAVKRAGGFDAHIVETHHAAKKDRPSGTAAAVAKVAGDALGREVPVTSVRTGHVPGTHEVIFDATFEQVRLVHEARDRRVFAEGALVAAAWLRGRRSGVYTMRDVVRLEEDG